MPPGADHVFISCAWEDRAIADWLTRRLTAAGSALFRLLTGLVALVGLVGSIFTIVLGWSAMKGVLRACSAGRLQSANGEAQAAVHAIEVPRGLNL